MDYRYRYIEDKDHYHVETFDTKIDHWIMDQNASLWTYDYDDNPSYFTTKFIIVPELMMLLKLKYN